jgi:DNA-binding MarR family transcriptional regulator
MGTPLLATVARRLHLAIRQRLLADLHAAGYTDLTPTHIYVFQTPGPDGVRPTELAAQTNMTKQAMNHVLAGLEASGYIERVRAEDDGRGKVLRLTERGRDVVRLMQQGSAAIERRWVRQIGRARIEELRRTLRDLDTLEVAAGTE